MTETTSRSESWGKGEAYEPYVGRWSRLVADRFLEWIEAPGRAAWLDVGCGTGALSQAILDGCDPKLINSIDKSEAYLQYASNRLHDPRVTLQVGDAQELPADSDAYDAAVSGLVINFVPEPAKMATEMKRAVRGGGRVALYVWDYAGKMEFMRHFWNAAAALDPAVHDLDEGRRFPICNREALKSLFQTAGLSHVDATGIDIDTRFRDFDDYWDPFEGGQGPAPVYLRSLPEVMRRRLRERLRDSLPYAIDGSIPLVARAWAVKGVKQ
jgi:SAM-dependent methyltransferase